MDNRAEVKSISRGQDFERFLDYFVRDTKYASEMPALRVLFENGSLSEINNSNRFPIDLLTQDLRLRSSKDVRHFEFIHDQNFREYGSRLGPRHIRQSELLMDLLKQINERDPQMLNRIREDMRRFGK